MTSASVGRVRSPAAETRSGADGQWSLITDHHPLCRYHAEVARTTKAELTASGDAALTRAIRSLGHEVRRASSADHGLDAAVDGIEVSIESEAASVITPETVARMVASADKRRTTLARVAIGDLITAPAKDALRDAGWGWLDRRGHLVLRAEGVHIDADVPPDERTTAGAPARPISGIAAVSWAAALLMAPDDPPSMREVARRVSISHSAVVAASKKLKAVSLIRADGRPLVPELFWTLADEWRHRPVALAELPATDDAEYGSFGLGLGDDGPGWAVAGTVGAAAWGAPFAIGRAFPPDFYVPSSAELRRATLRLGEAARFEERACTVAVAPTPLVCRTRFDRATNEWGHWRFAHGLFAALDLAQDRARGAEILADWNPTDFARVW
jgi:hypothetical protein